MYNNNFNLKSFKNDYNQKLENDENKKNNLTSKITKMILIAFFVFVGISLAGYYVYNFFESKKEPKEIKITTSVDQKLSNILNDLDKKDIKNDDKKNVIDLKNNCFIEGKSIENGSTVKMYSRKIVTTFENCEDFAKERKCDNGFLTGDKAFKYLTCDKNLDCELPNGQILKNGKSIKMYSRKKVPLGETCERYSEIRTCKNNFLTGTKEYVYPDCSVSYENTCQLENGQIMRNNQSHKFYDVPKVEFGDNCDDHSKILTCVDTILQGGDQFKYKYWSCSEVPPKNCFIDNIIVKHNTSVELYSKEYGDKDHNCDWYKDTRHCFNGKLDGQEEYKYAKCYDE